MILFVHERHHRRCKGNDEEDGPGYFTAFLLAAFGLLGGSYLAIKLKRRDALGAYHQGDEKENDLLLDPDGKM